MEEDEIFISLPKWKQLKDYLERIDQLFQVELYALSENSVCDDDQNEPTVHIRLSCSAGNRDLIDKAKCYVASVVASESDKTVQLRPQSRDSLQFLSAHTDRIERQSQAVLSVLDRERLLCVWGLEDNVHQACVLMDHLLTTAGPKVADEYDESTIFVPNLTLSPSVDSNQDSCYDSDTSSVGSGGRSTAHRRDSNIHCDVLRTVSDTLASELTETESRPDTDDYEAKVERYVRLGFSESQLRLVLARLGRRPSHDDVLGELLGLEGMDDDEDDIDDPPTLSVPAVSSCPDEDGLRPVVIDGSNVAMSHGNKEVFSCRGIQLAVDWFESRGHEDITVFVPQWRKEASRADAPISDQEILVSLEKQKRLVFTPARRIQGKRVVCYDDRYIVKLAAQNGGVVVSNDNYRDLMSENPEYKKVIEQRLLMYSFVNDRFMPPDDPLGRHGPSVDTFLQKEPRPDNCPYANRCTFGNKCKFFHPERGSQPHKMMSEKLAESAKQTMKKRQLVQSLSTSVVEKQGLRKDTSPTKTSLSKTKSLAFDQKKQLTRTKSLNPALASQSSEQNQKPPDNSTLEPSSQDRLRRTGRMERDSLTCPKSDRLSQNHDSLSASTNTHIQKDLLQPPYPTHDALRQIRSDPNSQQKGSTLGSHVKVSRNRSSEFHDGIHHQEREHGLPSGYDERHAKLNRQLSLEGAHDPRLQHANCGERDWRSQNNGATSNLLIPRPSNTPPVSMRPHHSVSRTGSLANNPPQTHAPLAKMDSAPASQLGAINACEFTQPVPPLVKRQSSTSDPQLNLADPETHNRWSSSYTQIMPNQIILPLQNNQVFSSDQAIANIPHARVVFNPKTPQLLGQHQRGIHHYPNQPQPAFLPFDRGLQVPMFNPTQDREPPLLMAPTERDLVPASFPVPPLHTVGSVFHPMPFVSDSRNANVYPPQQPDPSSQTFSHLCNIFPESKVRHVMQEHPNETDPQVLCSFLVKL